MLIHSKTTPHPIFEGQYSHSVLTCDSKDCPCTIVVPNISSSHDVVLVMAQAGRWGWLEDFKMTKKHYCSDHTHIAYEREGCK